MIQLKQPTAEELERSKRKLEILKREQQNSALIESGFPSRHVKKICMDANGWTETADQLCKFCGSGFLVILAGPPGRGKTQIGVEIARRRKGSSLYTMASILFRRFEDARKQASVESEYGILKEVWAPSFLVLDEISNRSGTDSENRLLNDILIRRFDSGKDSLLITYHTPRALTDKGSPFKLPSPVIDRISENGLILECNWPSFRK
jgi:DNA replication protein DnaC